MLNKLKKVKKVSLALTALFMSVMLEVPAFALESDLEYKFTTMQSEEFVSVGATSINFSGAIPDYLLNIYDFTPQTVYTSEYGSNIVLPSVTQANYTTYAPANAPVSGTFVQSPNGLLTGVTQSGSENSPSSSDTIPEYTYTNPNPYQLTSIEDVINEDGSIGTLKINAIDLKVTAYDGDTYEAMKKGIGHIASTSVWSGNIGLVGHNRGTNAYFGKLKNLSIGDKITYTTNLGTRTYYVTYIGKISDTDWSKLQYTSDNRITLTTCVENVGDQRLCVQAVEKLD